MSDNQNSDNAASASNETDNIKELITTAPEPEQLPEPPITNSNVTTPASSVTGIPTRRLKIPSNYGGSTGSVSKIGRLCSHAAPKAGPPTRDTNSMSRESDDNLSSIHSAYTDMYQETVNRFTRSSLSPEMDRYSPSRMSFKSTSTSQKSDPTRRTSYDNYLEATGRRRSSDHGAVLTFDTEQFIIGQKVWVGGIRSGQIAYIGETHFAPGEWAGVVLDEPNGKNDGCVSGKRYFQCEPKRGIFSRLTRLTTTPIAGALTPTSPLSKNSPERSRTVSPTSSLMSTNLRSPGKNGLTVGDRVIVSSGFGSRPGILRYLGETQFASGNWCGIELDEASGKNDGSVDGTRYFECKPKYGVFVPIAKVSLSPSSKKCRLHRSGSRESLTSIGTMNSIATTNTSRMRMSAQRNSLSQVRPLTSPKTQFKLQDLLREKQNHIEQLLIERDLDREDTQNQALQYQKSINELKSHVTHLEHQLIEKHKKTEELQNLVDEATFCGEELNVQTQDYKDQIKDLENKITELTSGNPSIQSLALQDNSAAIAQATESLNKQIREISTKLQQQEKGYVNQIAELRDEETRLQENLKYLQAENETLQKQLLEKDESLEKFSLSECGIENLRCELNLLKTEAEKEKQQILTGFKQQLDEKNLEIKQLHDQLIAIRNSVATLESDHSSVTDECDILRSECKARDETIQKLNEQVAEITSELSMQKAESSTLDEMLNGQKQQCSDGLAALEAKTNEIRKLSEQLAELQNIKLELEKSLNKSKEETSNLEKLRQELESKFSQESLDLGSKTEHLNEENNKLREELKKLLENAAEYKITEENLRKDLEQQRQIADETDNKLNTTSIMLNNLQLEMKKLSEQADNNLLEKTKELDKLNIELKTLRERNHLLEKESSVSSQQMGYKLAELQEQNEKLQDSLKLSEAALQDKREESLKQEQKFAENLKELKSNAEALETTNKLIHKLREELDASFNKCKELEVNVKRSEENCAQQQLQLGDSSRKFEALSLKCTNLKEQCEKLEEDLLAARSNGSELQTNVKKLHEEMSIKQQSYVERENQSNAERLQLESTIEELKQNITKSNNEQEDLQKILQTAKNEIITKNTEITDLQQKIIKLELEVSDSLRQHENLNAKFDALAVENKSLQQNLLILRTSTTDSNTELQKLSQELSSKQKAYDELVDKSSSERASLEGQLQSSQQRVDMLCNQIETLTQELKSTSEENFERIQQLKEKQDQCSKQELEINDLNRKFESLIAKSEALVVDNQSLQKEISTLRSNTTESHDAMLKLTEELAAKQKLIQENTDKSSAVRLELESQVQELKQQLEASSAETDNIKYELLTCKETNLLLAQEFDTYKANLMKSTEDNLEQLKKEESEKRRRIIEDFEVQLKNADKSKTNLDDAISSLQNQIKLLQEELLKSQLDFKSKEEEFKRQINALTTEKEQLRDSLQRVQNEGSTSLSSVQQEKIALLESIQKLSNEISTKDRQLLAVSSEAKQAKISNANAMSDMSKLESDVKVLQNSLDLATSEVEYKAKIAQEQQQKINELRGFLESLQHSNANISATNAELVEALKVLEQEKCEISNIFEFFEMESDQNITKLIENVSTMKSELSKTVAQLQTKDAAFMESQKELAKLKSDMQSIQNVLQEKETISNDANEHLNILLQETKQKLELTEANNIELQQRFAELEEKLNEYKEVIDEMDDTSKTKSTTLETLEKKLHAERNSNKEMEQALKAECEILKIHVEKAETERAREVLQLSNQIKMFQLQSSKLQSSGAGDGIDSFEDNSAQINFLNSIIADMQKKNEELKSRLHTLEAIPIDFTKSNAFDQITKRKPAPRMFCDICDEFDKHETEDCPLQASEDYSPPLSRAQSINTNDPTNKKERKLPEPRKYCESCEVFGHQTGECDAECF